MNAKTIVATLITLAGATNPANAETDVPAWQEAGFIMEEVIATAPRIAVEPTREWQQPGYVMEEVVVTTTRSEALQTLSRARSLMPVQRNARPLHPLIRRFAWDLIRHAGEFDIQFDPFSVAP